MAPFQSSPVLVSACLLGLACRYDGGARERRELVRRLAGGGPLVPICPEQLGGLPTPRPPAELKGGDGLQCLEQQARVVDAQGRDVTPAFVKGAEMAVTVARLTGAQRALLKARSPACGVRGRLGVAAAALILAGLEVMDLE